MRKNHGILPKSRKKAKTQTKNRRKLGVTQEQLASIFGVSRSYIAHIESGKRNFSSQANTLLTNMFFQFQELETGKQAAERTLETRLFLNVEYKRILPQMDRLEKDCRLKIKMLKKDLEKMKEQARDAEHAIIVFTTAIKSVEETDIPANKKESLMTGLLLFKQQAYGKLLTCWEPEQAKLHGKIEAVAGEARALRRYRIKVTREHNPFKKKQKKIDS